MYKNILAIGFMITQINISTAAGSSFFFHLPDDLQREIQTQWGSIKEQVNLNTASTNKQERKQLQNQQFYNNFEISSTPLNTSEDPAQKASLFQAGWDWINKRSKSILVLSITNFPVSKEQWFEIANNSQKLQTLQVHNNKTFDDRTLFAFLSNCKTLKKIEVDNCAMSFKRLPDMDISNQDLTVLSLEELKICDDAIGDFNDNMMINSFVAFIQLFPNLISLDLDTLVIGMLIINNDVKQEIKNLPKLTEVRLAAFDPPLNIKNTDHISFLIFLMEKLETFTIPKSDMSKKVYQRLLNAAALCPNLTLRIEE